MVSRSTVIVWMGIILLSGMFLMGQDTWPLPDCFDNDGDGYGNPASRGCAFPDLDCDDDNALVNPGTIEGLGSLPGVCSDAFDNDCDGFVDDSDSGCTFRIMPLGDSITAGSLSGVVDPDEWVSYRGALWDKLITAGYQIDFVGSRDNGSAGSSRCG